MIGGNPAKVLKKLDRNKCVFHKSEYEYNGYISSRDFAEFRKKLELVVFYASDH